MTQTTINPVEMTYNEFKKQFLPFAKDIIKKQNLFRTMFSEEERVEFALVDAYMKRGKYDPSKGASFSSFIYVLLRNYLCKIQPYDRDSYRIYREDKKAEEEMKKEAEEHRKKEEEMKKEVNEGKKYLWSLFNSCIMDVKHDCKADSSKDDQDDSFDDGSKFMSEYMIPSCDAEDCLLLSLKKALLEMSEKDFLILTGSTKDCLKAKDELHDEFTSSKELLDGIDRAVNSKHMSREEIGEILSLSASNVGYIRNTLTNDLALRMLAIFKEAYLGDDPEKTFNRMLNKLKQGRTVVKKNGLIL